MKIILYASYPNPNILQIYFLNHFLQLENLSAECEQAKKDADMWKIKCEKKEIRESSLYLTRAKFSAKLLYPVI